MKEQIDKYNEAYRTGNALISDAEYDAMCEEANYTPAVGHEIEEGKVELPIPMGSLNKLKTMEELNKWLGKYPEDAKLVATPKFDGCAVLLTVTDRKVSAIATRGNGTVGRDITSTIGDHPQIIQLNKNLSSYVSDELPQSFYMVGELVMEEPVFEKKYSNEFKNSRNLVAGLINRSEKQKAVDDCIFVFFNIKSDDITHGKLTLLKLIESEVCLGMLNTTYHVVTSSNIKSNPTYQEDIFTVLRNAMNETITCDGVVLEFIDSDLRSECGLESNSLNPAYARAFKPQTEERRCTKVREIEWTVSKDGKIIPVAHLLPVELDGVTISKVTLYNARFVQENEIVPNRSIMELCRSGGVIPKCLRIINPEEDLSDF